MAPRLQAPHKPQRHWARYSQSNGTRGRKKQRGKERWGLARKCDKNQAKTEEKSRRKYKRRETGTQWHATSANLFSKSDINEGLCNKNTTSLPAMIWKEILHYSSTEPRRLSNTHREKRFTEGRVTLVDTTAGWGWRDPLLMVCFFTN